MTMNKLGCPTLNLKHESTRHRLITEFWVQRHVKGKEVEIFSSPARNFLFKNTLPRVTESHYRRKSKMLLLPCS